MSNLLLSIRPTEIVKHHLIATDFRQKVETLAEEVWSDVSDKPELLDAVVEGSLRLGETLRDELAELADECPHGVTKLLLTFALNCVQWHVVSYPFFVELAQKEEAYRAASDRDMVEEEEHYLCDSFPFTVREDSGE